jgi:hypothetical protein
VAFFRDFAIEFLLAPVGTRIHASFIGFIPLLVGSLITFGCLGYGRLGFVDIIWLNIQPENAQRS